MGVMREFFGFTPDGTRIDLFTLHGGGGLEIQATQWGAALVSAKLMDESGRTTDVVLGFDNLQGYLGNHPYFGGTIGRYANRIAGGRFELNGKAYQLACNDGANHLHGGRRGFDRVVWEAKTGTGSEPAVEFSYVSPAGEEGYPGTLSVSVTYSVSADNALRIDYRAAGEEPTVVNLTNHAYFNLAGSGTITHHLLEIAATRFLPVDERLIPTGEEQTVQGTPMDFTTPTAIGAHIHDDDRQLRRANGGYDHNWILDKGPGLSRAARVWEPASGRAMEVFTTQPGLQFYSGNFLDGTITGKRGIVYRKHEAFCLETQHFPDSPHHPSFPSTVLLRGQTYEETTIYAFKFDTK